MAVPQYSGNAFNASMHGMADIFHALRANKQLAIQNQYLPQSLDLANQGALLANNGKDLSNRAAVYQLQNDMPLNTQLNEQKLSLANALQPSQVGGANLAFDQAQKMNPIQIAIAQQQQQQAQNTNELFPLQKQQLSLQNTGLGYQNNLTRQQGTLMQQGFIPWTNPATGETTYINTGKGSGGGGGAGMKMGQVMMDAYGNPIGTPTTEALGQNQKMNTSRAESEQLLNHIQTGLSPYQGASGKARMMADVFAYKTGLASDSQKERLQNYQAAQQLIPSFTGALGRATSGGVPSREEMEDIQNRYHFNGGGSLLDPLGGLSERDYNEAQTKTKRALQEAGQQSTNVSISPSTGHPINNGADGAADFNFNSDKGIH